MGLKAERTRETNILNISGPPCLGQLCVEQSLSSGPPSSSLEAQLHTVGCDWFAKKIQKEEKQEGVWPISPPPAMVPYPLKSCNTLLHSTPNFALQAVWPGHCRVSPGCKLEHNVAHFLAVCSEKQGRSACMHAGTLSACSGGTSP